MKVILSEGLGSAVMIYLIVKRLATPFKDWKAYELGIIDEKGKKLKDPKSSEERNAWTLFDKFIWNLRKILTKFVGQSRLAAVLTTAYLLKDSTQILLKQDSFLNEHAELIEGMTIAKQNEIYYLAKTLTENLVLVEGEETENSVFRHYSKVQELFSDEDIKRIFEL